MLYDFLVSSMSHLITWRRQGLWDTLGEGGGGHTEGGSQDDFQ